MEETLRYAVWIAFDTVVLFVVFRFLFRKLRSKMAEVEARKQASWDVNKPQRSIPLNRITVQPVLTPRV